MKVLYLMCGLAFAGKSTLARAIVRERGCAYISLDDINKERGLGFGGDGIPGEQWEQTHYIALARLEEEMHSGHTIVLDDTNNQRQLRDRFRRLAQQNGYETQVIYLDIPVEVIHQRMQRNAETQERHGVQPHIFADLVRSFEPPADDENIVVFRQGDRVDDWLRRCLPDPR